jgi:hypothetical protein
MLGFFGGGFQIALNRWVSMRNLPGASQMSKVLALIGVVAATLFAGWARLQFSNLPILGGDNAVEKRQDTKLDLRTESRDNSRSEPTYKTLIRCLSDLDDMLDSIVNPATFVTVRPLLLKRVRQHVADVSDRSQGMAKLSPAASQEMQQAMNRHAASLTRAIKVAPGVEEFFSHQIAAVLSAK